MRFVRELDENCTLCRDDEKLEERIIRRYTVVHHWYYHNIKFSSELVLKINIMLVYNNICCNMKP